MREWALVGLKKNEFEDQNYSYIYAKFPFLLSPLLSARVQTQNSKMHNCSEVENSQIESLAIEIQTTISKRIELEFQNESYQ